MLIFQQRLSGNAEQAMFGGGTSIIPALILIGIVVFILTRKTPPE